MADDLLLINSVLDKLQTV